MFLFAVSFAFAGNDSNSNRIIETNIQIEESAIDSIIFLDKVVGICTINIRAYNQDGELVGSATLYFESESAYHCAQLAAAFREALQQY